MWETVPEARTAIALVTLSSGCLVSTSALLLRSVLRGSSSPEVLHQEKMSLSQSNASTQMSSASKQNWGGGKHSHFAKPTGSASAEPSTENISTSNGSARM